MEGNQSFKASYLCECYMCIVSIRFVPRPARLCCCVWGLTIKQNCIFDVCIRGCLPKTLCLGQQLIQCAMLFKKKDE